MENKTKSDESVCRSIFKNGDSTTKDLYTEKWIELINRLEKGKKDSVSV